MSAADGLLIVPEGKSEVEPGELVSVIPLRGVWP
jgi:molybdopterin biosynthesis enzyme